LRLATKCCHFLEIGCTKYWHFLACTQVAAIELIQDKISTPVNY
jgi:hypothetical protein